MMAQGAATTRQFNVKDEIEVKDDLDNKPDDDLKAFLDNNYETAISAFVEDLRQLKQQGKLKSKGRKGFAINAVHRFCSENNVSATSSFSPTDASEANAWIEDAFVALHKNFSIADKWKFASVPSFIQVPQGVSEDDRCKIFGRDTELGKSDVVIRLTFSRETPQSAALFTGFVNQQILQRAAVNPDALTKQIYEYTRASNENNQVSIVTRLPRSSIDSLLAYSASKTAKKN